MWIANTSWNAAILFPSLGYSYQLGLNSSHLTSAICKVAVEALPMKEGNPETELQRAVLSLIKHISKVGRIERALEVPPLSLSLHSWRP